MRDNMNGRQKCEIVNQIRKKVADNNGIDFEISECTLNTNCSRRCEKTDSELEYLESELEKRQSEGVKLNLKGVFALDMDAEPKKQSSSDSLKRQKKLEELKNNPFLSDLPPRYLDNLLD